MLVSVDFKEIVALVRAKVDEWDAMTESQRDRAKIDRGSAAFRFLDGNPLLEQTISDVVREKRFKGLRTVDAAGDVSGPACIAALGRKKKPPRMLGEGFFGEIYEHPSDRTRVLKIVTHARADPESAIKEAELMKRAAAAGVSPKFHGVRVCRGKGALVDKRLVIFEMGKMERTLQDWVTGEPRSHEEKKRMVKKIDAKLQKLHALGISHQDIHPENVMVDSKGQPFIIDFGEATDATDLPGMVSETAVWLVNRIMRGMNDSKFRNNNMNRVIDFATAAIAERADVTGV